MFQPSGDTTMLVATHGNAVKDKLIVNAFHSLPMLQRGHSTIKLYE